MKTSHRALNERFAFVVCKKQAEIKDPCIRIADLFCSVFSCSGEKIVRNERRTSPQAG